jgi:hypothetical protein
LNTFLITKLPSGRVADDRDLLRKYFHPCEVAWAVERTERHLKRQRQYHQGMPFKKDGRSVYYHEDDINRYLEARELAKKRRA